jgi:hypothetical protein
MTVFENVKDVKIIGGKEKRVWSVENGTPERFAEELMSEGWGFLIRAETEAAVSEHGRGRPVEYPDAMVVWGMKIMYAFRIGYRAAKGIMKSILKRMGMRCIGVSQLHRRACELADGAMSRDLTDVRVLAKGVRPLRGPEGRRRVVAVDSTGVVPSKAGEWRIKVYGQKTKRGWIKFHAMTDTDTNEILAFVISEENYNDNLCFMMLVGMAVGEGYSIGRIYGDGAYDAKENWNLRRAGIEFISNLRKNSSGKFDGSAPRGLQALRRKEIGEKAWKIEVGYGRRWKIECAFSDFKRMLSETLRSRKKENMVLELFWKIVTFNQYKAVRRDLAEAA